MVYNTLIFIAVVSITAHTVLFLYDCQVGVTATTATELTMAGGSLQWMKGMRGHRVLVQAHLPLPKQQTCDLFRLPAFSVTWTMISRLT